MNSDNRCIKPEGSGASLKNIAKCAGANINKNSLTISSVIGDDQNSLQQAYKSPSVSPALHVGAMADRLRIIQITIPEYGATTIYAYVWTWSDIKLI